MKFFGTAAMSVVMVCISVTTHAQSDREQNGGRELQPPKNLRVTSSTPISFDVLGRIQMEQEFEHYALDVPPIVALLFDKECCEELGLTSKQTNKIQDKVDKLRKSWKELESEAFQKEVNSIEELVSEKLMDEQVAACNECINAASFYTNGLAEFARQKEISSQSVRSMRSKVPELAKKLEESIRELEQEILVDLFGDIKRKPIEELLHYVEIQGGFWQPNVSILWQGLEEMAADKPKSYESAEKYRSFVVSSNGRLQVSGAQAVDLLSDISTLFSAQKWQMNDDPAIREFFETALNKRMELQRELTSKRAELQDIYENDKRKLKIEQERISEWYLDELKELADDFSDHLGDNEKKIYAHAKFLSDLRRLGFQNCLEFKPGSESHYKFSKKEIGEIRDRASDAAEKLQRKAYEIQAEVFGDLTSDLSEEEKQAFAFSDPELFTGIPPLELLLFHLNQEL